MALQLHSSQDFDLTTTDVNIDDGQAVPSRPAHVQANISFGVTDFNAHFEDLVLNVADNVRTVTGALKPELLKISYASRNNANTRALQIAYFEAIAATLYSAGSADSQTAKPIGSTQITVPTNPVTVAGDVNTTLWSNSLDLALEAEGKFSDALDAHRTEVASGDWLNTILVDLHQNPTQRALLAPVSADEPDDNFKINLAENDAVMLYFTMISDTDDGVLGTSRTDSQVNGGTQYSNPSLDKIRISVNMQLVTQAGL